jgi:hypothetical protein
MHSGSMAALTTVYTTKTRRRTFTQRIICTGAHFFAGTTWWFLSSVTKLRNNRRSVVAGIRKARVRRTLRSVLVYVCFLSTRLPEISNPQPTNPLPQQKITHDRFISNHILRDPFLIHTKRSKHRPRPRVEHFPPVNHHTDNHFFPAVVAPYGGTGTFVVQVRNVCHDASHGACKEDFVFLPIVTKRVVSSRDGQVGA